MYERVAGRCKKAWLCVPFRKDFGWFWTDLGPGPKMGPGWVVSRPKKNWSETNKSYKHDIYVLGYMFFFTLLEWSDKPTYNL